MGAVLAGLSGIAGAGAGAAQSQNQAQQIAQNYALNKRGQALQEGLNANALERQTQTNPLRDQAIYNLSGMLGAAPAAFNPTSMLTPGNSGQQGVGGVNQNALASYQGAYTPGAGGVTSNVQQMLLNRLGYGNVATGTLFDNPSTPADKLTGTPGAAITTGGSNKGGAGVNPPDPYSASQNTGYTPPGTTSGNPSVGTGGGSTSTNTGTAPGQGGNTTGGGGGTGTALSATPMSVYSPPAPSAQATGVGPAAIPPGASASGMGLMGSGAMAPAMPAASAAPGAAVPAGGAAAGATGGMSAQQLALMKMLGAQQGGGLGGTGMAGMMAAA